MRLQLLAVCLLLDLLPANISISAGAQPATDRSLTFIWHAGDRADQLLRLSKDYTRETGVTVHAILPPLTDEYHQRIADEFAKKGAAFDLCIFDSQSMSEFASQGHVVRLNDRLANSKKIRLADFDPLALQRYAEYPDGSGNIYALPINQDCMGLAYRKDLVENPQERAAFRMKYGYELQVPESYDQLRDVAEFFTRPEQQLYGIALFGSPEYDACTSALNNVLWSFGADLWDPKTGKASGHINSPKAVAALTVYKNLFTFAPPGFQNAYVSEVNAALHEGRCALGIQWYYYFDELAAGTARTKHKLAFAALPGQKGADGVFRRFVMVGGQGVSINKYSQHKDEAWRFLEWFFTKERQWKWVEGGGKTGLAAILHDPRFSALSAANESFPESMSRTRDYWHLRAYPELLRAYQKHVHEALTGQVEPEQALNQCAQEHDAILKSAGAQSAAMRRPSTSRLTVVARIRAKPGMEQQVKEELLRLLTPSRREQGCINYDMHLSADEDGLFLFYETWESETQLEKHLASPHIQGWFARSHELLAEPIEITRWKKVD